MVLVSLSSRAVTGRLWHTLNGAPDIAWVQALAGSPIQSNQPTETYGGLGTVPPMRLWLGERRTAALRDITFAIANAKYESSLRILGDDLRYIRIGQVERRIQDLRVRWAQHWGKLASDLLIANGLGYDGQNFFDSDHAENAGAAQTNLSTSAAATGTNPTAGEMETAILAATQVLLGLKDDQGEPTNQDKSTFIVMVPVIFWAAAAAAIGAPVIVDTAATGGRTNVIGTLQGFSFQLVVNPRMTATDYFWVFAADGNVLIRQVVEDLKISQKAEGSEYEFDHDMHEYGVMTVRAMGYGNWQSAVKHTFT